MYVFHTPLNVLWNSEKNLAAHCPNDGYQQKRQISNLRNLADTRYEKLTDGWTAGRILLKLLKYQNKNAWFLMQHYKKDTNVLMANSARCYNDLDFLQSIFYHF